MWSRRYKLKYYSAFHLLMFSRSWSCVDQLKSDCLCLHESPNIPGSNSHWMHGCMLSLLMAVIETPPYFYITLAGFVSQRDETLDCPWQQEFVSSSTVDGSEIDNGYPNWALLWKFCYSILNMPRLPPSTPIFMVDPWCVVCILRND